MLDWLEYSLAIATLIVASVSLFVAAKSLKVAQSTLRYTQDQDKVRRAQEIAMLEAEASADEEIQNFSLFTREEKQDYSKRNTIKRKVDILKGRGAEK